MMEGMVDELYTRQQQYPSQTERTSCDTKDNLDALHVVRRTVGCSRHVQEDACTPW